MKRRHLLADRYLPTSGCADDKVRFAADSLLEGAGFEPSVPGHSELCCGALPLVAARGEVDTVGQPDFFCSLSHSTEPGAYTVLVGCGLRRCSAAAACWR